MLDINDGTAIIEASSVDLAVVEHPIPKKIKGKKLGLIEYDELIKKFFAESIEGERYPYWEIRY